MATILTARACGSILDNQAMKRPTFYSGYLDSRSDESEAACRCEY